MRDFKTLSAKQPAGSIFVGPGHGGISTARRVRVPRRERRYRERSSNLPGRRRGGSIMVKSGGRWPREPPGPIVMLAIDKYIRNDSRDQGCGVEDVAWDSWLNCRIEKDVNTVRCTVGECRRESKVHVACNEEVVAGVVLQFQGVTGANDEPNDSAANRVLWLCAGNLNGGDTTDNRAGAIRHRASLNRVRWLGLYRYGVTSAAKKGRGKSEADRTRTRDGNVVAAVVLQYKPGTGQTDD